MPQEVRIDRDARTNAMTVTAIETDWSGHKVSAKMEVRDPRELLRGKSAREYAVAFLRSAAELSLIHADFTAAARCEALADLVGFDDAEVTFTEVVRDPRNYLYTSLVTVRIPARGRED